MLLKNNAKKFAEKLARNKAEQVFMERVNPMTMFTDSKKKQFIEKISKQYEPIFYRDIINKIITQKVMEEQNKVYSENISKKYKKKGNTELKVKETTRETTREITKESNDENREIAESIINSSRQVYDLLQTGMNDNQMDNEELSESILQNIEQCENIEESQNLFSNKEQAEGNLVMSILKKENSNPKIKPTFNN